MEIRSIEIRSVDTEARTIEGVVAPYDELRSMPDGINERYAPGVFDDFDADNARPLYAEHGHLSGNLPVGQVVEGRSEEHGFVVRAKFSDTPRGDEAWTLVKEKTLKGFSAGFELLEGGTEYDNETKTVTHTRANLVETSVTGIPAFKTAGITAFRSLAASSGTEGFNGTAVENKNNEKGDNKMSENTYASEDSVAELRSAMDEMERRVAVGNDSSDEAAPQFRSGGDFLKALAKGDSAAQTQVRAYTGAVLADSHASNDWRTRVLNVVDRGRPVVNLFSRSPLGDSGMTIEYPYVNTLTGDVAVQAAEGDDLAYLEVDINTATAVIKTYGGYSELSRQVIERSDVSYLDAVLRFQAASYAKVTNAAARAAMVAATPQTSGVATFALTAATATTFVDLAVDAVSKVDANGQGAQADFVLVSPDVFAKMANVSGTSRAFDVNNSNGQTIGSVNVRGLAGELAGLPVVIDSGLAVKTFYVASSDAVTTFENSGAPVRLQDENIINLSKQFSLYGYMAVAVTNANGLVKATIT